MTAYKLFLFNDGELIGRLTRELADDLDAVDFAYDLCRNHAIDVFDGERLVARVKQGSEPLKGREDAVSSTGRNSSAGIDRK
jgi:hypothetical protein